MTHQKKIRFGMVGLGFRLGHLGRLLMQADSDVEMVSYADPQPAGLETLQKAGASPKGYDTLDEMIAKEDFDILMIGSPNHLHLEHIQKGLEAGYQIFSEKPIVVSEQQTWQLAELLQKHGTQKMSVGLVLRYSQHMRDLKKFLPKLGQIGGMEATEHIAPYHGAFFMRDWRRFEKYSGGFLIEKCCHDFDIYNMIVNSRPKKIASFGGRKSFVKGNEPPAGSSIEVFHRKPSGWQGSNQVFDSQGDIIDYQTVLMEYENGANLSFHTNLNVPDEYRRFAVIGSSGMAEGDFMRGFLKIHDAHSGKILFDQQYSKDGSGHYGADELMVKDLLAFWRDSAEQPVSVVDAMIAGLVALKADESRKTGTMIDLQNTWNQLDSYALV